MTRRDFLRTGSGMAAALLALNQVFGDCYDVEAAEVDDPKAFEEKWPKDQFIFDMQTHHVDVSRKWYDDTPDGKADRCASSSCCGRSPAVAEKSLEQLNRAHYVKEVFGDSDTVMAVISGVPTPRVGQEPAAARPDGRHAQVRQRPGRLAAGAVARPAAAQPRARRSSTRWSGRSRS